jgi:hypothetical protein
LKELKDETKIDSSAHEAYKDKFYRLHKQLEQNYSNEKSLLQRGHHLKKQLQAENLKFEKAQTQQSEHRYTLTALSEKLDAVKKNFNEIDEVNTSLH